MEQSSALGVVRLRCLRMCFPGGCVDCGSGGRGRWPLRPKKTTTTPPPLPWTLTPSPRLRTRGVQSYQQTLKERPFLSMRHVRGQHYYIVRRAAPERAASPTTSLLGATSAQLLPTPPHRLSHHTTQYSRKHHRVRRETRGGEKLLPVSGSHDELC